MPKRKGQRSEEILVTLAEMLESARGRRITTASLASRLDVSEAALYRHFPSKTKMFEALINFAEDAIFTRTGKIIRGDKRSDEQCRDILTGVLVFAERNPGISRILSGEVLLGEDQRLRRQVGQLFDRLETQIRQILREAEIRESRRPNIPLGASANLLMAMIEGRIAQFVRTDFSILPTHEWDLQWEFLIENFFREVPRAAASNTELHDPKK